MLLFGCGLVQVGLVGEVVLSEGGEGVVATLQLLSSGSHLSLNTQLTVHTNLTTVDIPVTAYNGRLTKVTIPITRDIRKLRWPSIRGSVL